MFEEIEFLDIEENAEFEKLIQKVVRQCFEIANVYLNIILTDSENIKQINQRYRNIDKETDVLSFPMFEKEEINHLIEKSKLKEIEVQEVLGDIVISIPRVKQQALEYGHNIERELSYMIVHGFYHIMGYDHMNEEEKNIMRAKEEKVLNLLNITRDNNNEKWRYKN